jgi:branched-subunit amino acid transport protein
MPEGALLLAPTNLRLVAGLIAALVAWRTRRTLLSIGVGMVVLWVLQALG